MPDPKDPGQKPILKPILVLNSGSSSLKAALFTREGDRECAIVEASASGIGQTQGKLVIRDLRGGMSDKPGGTPPAEDHHDYRSQTEALSKICDALGKHAEASPFAIGHRIVHGGMHLTRHQALTAAVLKQLEQAVHFAPLHIPGSLALIRKSEELYPGVPQFACFDTAFHQTLPESAWRLPIPRAYAEAGVRRYGFHGLSYESIVAQLRDQGRVPDRLIVAHLGSGSSLAAILRGQSVDTSMGFTPAGGIPMATRTGDLDPGVLIYMMRNGLGGAEALDLDQAEELINHQSGLSALSDGISDMQKLEAASANRADARASAEAALAIDIFTTAVAKTIAGYIVSLGGLDTLVFTGGIGEHAAGLRAAVIERLSPLGFRLDKEANASHAACISAPASQLVIRVLPAEEDLQIATHVRALMT